MLRHGPIRTRKEVYPICYTAKCFNVELLGGSRRAKESWVGDRWVGVGGSIGLVVLVVLLELLGLGSFWSLSMDRWTRRRRNGDGANETNRRQTGADRSAATDRRGLSVRRRRRLAGGGLAMSVG